MSRPRITILSNAVSFILKTLLDQEPQDTADKALLGIRTGSYRNNAKEENSDCFSRVSPLLSEVGPKNDLKPAVVCEVKVYQTAGDP